MAWCAARSTQPPGRRAGQAARRGPVRCNAASGGRCSVPGRRQRRDVRVLFAVAGKEVEDRAVVPEAPRAARPPFGDVGDDPRHTIRLRAEPCLGFRQPACRDVEHRQVAVTGGEQRVDQPRRAAAHVEDPGRRVRCMGRDQFQRARRPRLKPADRGLGLCRVGALPMLTRVAHAVFPLTSDERNDRAISAAAQPFRNCVVDRPPRKPRWLPNRQLQLAFRCIGAIFLLQRKIADRGVLEGEGWACHTISSTN